MNRKMKTIGIYVTRADGGDSDFRDSGEFCRP